MSDLFSDRLPFVALPSIIRWDADNDIYVTPLRQPQQLVDIAVEISAELNGAKYSAFSNLFRNLPSDMTSKLTASVKQESPSGSYNIRVRVTGHEDFTATVGNGPNVRRIHVQTDKVFYAPAERVNVRLLPLTYEGTIYNGKIDLMLIDPNGFRIHNKTVQAGDRFVPASFELPQYLQFGDWKVVAKAVGSPREKFDALIRVQEYVMPKYRVLLSIEPSHQSVFTLMTTVYAKFAQGLPVSGDISIRCSLASQRDNATLNGHTVAPTQKKLTSETVGFP
ncbi:complement component C3-like protein [Aphelenchoides avenae]|nr:complement component C3-like protein [Aphelenchus avenae]KAH7701931.1 complement component C3-like protein [Aphelenchus avenae]